MENRQVLRCMEKALRRVETTLRPQTTRRGR